MFAWILLHSNGYRNIKSRSWLGTIHLTESGCILLPKMNVRSNPSSGDWVLLATPLLTISSKFYFSPTRQTNGKQKVWTAYFNSSHPHESSNTLKVVPLVGDISQAKILRLLPTMVQVWAHKRSASFCRPQGLLDQTAGTSSKSPRWGYFDNGLGETMFKKYTSMYR